MTKIGIITDVHANLEALDAVLKELEREGVDKIVCLGDIVGYGPNPRETYEIVKDKCSIRVTGNHDAAACARYPASGNFNQIAEESIIWTAGQLSSTQLKEMFQLPSIEEKGELIYVHGSPVQGEEYQEYMAADKIRFVSGETIITQTAEEKVERAIIECGLKPGTIVFHGHTHIPIIFNGSTIRGEALYSQPHVFAPEEIVFLNPGAVGQRRLDLNCHLGNMELFPINQAKYAIYEPGTRTVRFGRVEYDAKKTAEKLRAEQGLAIGVRKTLADRLESGY